MAHVGKIIPRGWVNYLNFISTPLSTGPVRKLNLRQFVGTPSGTLAELWLGVVMQSEVGDYWPDDERQTFYRFVCPNDSLMHLDVRYELTGPTDPSAASPVYEYVCHGSVFRDGELIAEGQRLLSPSTCWQRALGNVIWGPSWAFQVGFPRWVSCRIDTRPANWEEQPEYHPYRYEP